MAVIVDIPGVGSVQATNAAENSTLQAILSAIQLQQGVNISAAGAKQLNIESSKAAKATSQAAGQVGFLGIQSKNTGNQLSDMGRKASMQFKMAAGALARSFTGSGGVAGMIDGLGTALGGLAKSVPVVGGAIAVGVGFLASQLSATAKGYESSIQSGASFGYSLDAMRKVAQDSKVTFGQLSAISIKAAESLSKFGGRTLAGSVSFSNSMRSLRNPTNGFSTSLLRMGMDFEQQGVAMADYMGQLASAGLEIDKLDPSSVAKGMFELTRQQKIMAQLNGTTLEQERQKQKAASQNISLQAALLKLAPEQRLSTSRLISSFKDLGGPAAEKFANELLAFDGSVATAQSAQFEMLAPTLAKGIREAIMPRLRDRTQGTDTSSNAAIIGGIKSDTAGLERDRTGIGEIARLGLAGVSNSIVEVANSTLLPAIDTFSKSTNKSLPKIIAGLDRIVPLASVGGPLDQAFVGLGKISQNLKLSLESLAFKAFNTTTIKAITNGLGELASAFDNIVSMATQDSAGLISDDKKKQKDLFDGISAGVYKAVKEYFTNQPSVDGNFYGGAIGLGQTSVVGESRPGGRGELITAGTDMNVVNNENSQSIVGTLKGVADKMASMSTAQRMDPDAMNAMKQLPGLVMQLTDVVRSTSRDNSDALNNLSYNI